MQNIIGQKKLLSKLDSYTSTTLSHSILLIGPANSGKALIAEYLANKFSLNYVKTSENLSRDDLIAFSQTPIKTLYLINLSDFVEKTQAMFLKFIEDYKEFIYVILTAESETGILQTIISRCTKFYMDPYTIDELKEVSWVKNLDEKISDLVFSICKTPGQLNSITEKIFKDIYNLCSTIVSKIKVAPYANTLSISTKINYKENYGKFDFNLFLNILEFISYKDYIDNKNIESLKIYLFTNERKQRLINKNYNKEAFMLNFLSDLWKETR